MRKISAIGVPLSLALLLAVEIEPSWSSPPIADVVRSDWYFRESLTAIRDWETILSRWEKETPEAERAPLCPIPANGEMVEWSNPIPLMLLPDEDKNVQVRLRVVGDKMEVERVAHNARTTRKTIAPGETILGYKHPGGGGKDQWYHRYYRKFDLLTTFRPKAAPFALNFDAPFDFRRGANELPVCLDNVTDRPLKITMELRFHSPQEERPCGQMVVTLAAAAKETVRFPVVLRDQGGGLLILTVNVADQSLWIPLLTYVEDAPSVMKSVGQILVDAPDTAAAARLATLHRKAKEWEGADSPPSGATWRMLFEEASALRDELLLRRINFDTLIFLKRKPFFSEQPFMDAHHCYNRPGGAVYRLSPVRPTGKVAPVVDSLGEGVYRDLCLHWSGKKFLFAFGNGSDRGRPKDSPPQNYNLYEADVDGKRLRQLTSSPKNDCEPFYLPDGKIGFTSDRSEHYVMCGSNIHAPNLFVMNGDGSDIRQLSFNVFNDFNPTVMPDGRILYSRWEYNERSVTSLHNPFTMNPDGTMVSPFYGNATIRPNVVMFPRPVPGSHKIMALFTGHHGQTHGPIGLIDNCYGLNGGEPLTVLTPGVPIIGEKIQDSRCGWFSDPAPLSETTYLCSFTPTVAPWLERSWALYVGDRHGALALVYRDPEISCAEPVPIVSRSRPHVLPPCGPDADATNAEATLLLLDVYAGMSGVPSGTAKYLRVLEDVPRKGVPHGGVIVTSGTPIYTIKRIFGVAPIEADGSAHFVVPANRNVYFEALDEDYCEIQRMRSVVCLKPGESRTCIGCHEPRTTAPPNKLAAASLREPSRPIPPPWGTKTISFLRDIQPLLNAKCIQCHTHDRMGNRVILTDDLTDQFTIGYEELLPYLKVANAMRWDHPDDVYPRPPYTYGSKASPLMKLLAAGHHDVQLTNEDWQRLVNWVDANAVYYDRYEARHPKRFIFTDSIKKPMEEVHSRRCASCHGKNDGRYGTWWLSLNRRDVKMSRALKAPLARSVGGWGRCDETVFADAADPDYKALLVSLTALRDALTQRPREDLLSIQGDEAEQQKVELPPPPPPRPHLKDDLTKGDWVYLSSLRWEKASAGWTPNRDGLPRLDNDVTNKPLRAGLCRYGRGIGTHAPSEIVYRLDGKYARFFAIICGAEEKGTVVFQVLGDDKCLYDSGVMHGLREVKRVDCSVAGMSRLRLVVTDAGDNYYCDMANWAAARLLKAR